MIILSAKIHLDRGWVASLKVTITQTFPAGVMRAGRFPELSLGETCNETAAIRLVSPAARRRPAGSRARPGAGRGGRGCFVACGLATRGPGSTPRRLGAQHGRAAVSVHATAFQL